MLTASRDTPGQTDAASPPGRTDLAWVLGFLVLLAVNSWNHVLWADELHAWGLTVLSGSLLELFHNLHYEGHPGLWHVMLWVPSRLTASPVGMQSVAFAVGAAIILMIGLRSPFSRTEKILLLLNYYVVFEYTAMSRNYGIALLLAMIYAMERRRTAPRPLVAGLLLGLMANTNVYALFLAACLTLEYAWTTLFEGGKPSRKNLARLLPGCVLSGGLGLLAVATFWPPHDITSHTGNSLQTILTPGSRFAHTLLRTLVAPFVPIDFSFPTSFAFPGNWFEGGKRVMAAMILLPFILVAQWTVLRHSKPLLLAMAGTALAVTVFPFLIYPAAIRHLGVMFIGFVFALWLLRRNLPARPWPVLALLALGAIGGGTALVGQWIRPFAVNNQVARWIQDSEVAHMPIVGDFDMRIEPVAILLHRSFWGLECLCEDKFVRFLNRRDGFTHESVPDRIAQVSDRIGPDRPFLLLAQERLDETRRGQIVAKGFRLTELAYFSGAERDKEMMIYRVDPPAR